MTNGESSGSNEKVVPFDRLTAYAGSSMLASSCMPTTQGDTGSSSTP
jgi:hypothetical protein